jgi:MYXO-CTERM domain-containing protein
VTGKCAQATATCADAFTVMTAGGMLVSCAPYKCLNGACQQQCVTNNDCAPGYDCMSSKCIPAPSTSSSSSGASSGGAGGQTSAANASSGSTSSASGAAGGAGAGTGGGGTKEPVQKGSCHCATAGEGDPAGSRLGLLALAAVVLARGRRRSGTPSASG